MDGNEYFRQCIFAESFKLNVYVVPIHYVLCWLFTPRGRGGGGTLGIFEWGCAAGTLESLA